MVSNEPTRDAAGGPVEDARASAVSRRRFLAASAGALATGLAGCSTLTDQEFTANPVGLPEAVRGEFGLPEAFTDSSTTTRERTISGQDVEVTVTSQYAGYQRSYAGPGTVWSAPRPTLVERFAGAGRTDTPGAGNIWSPAINVVASDLGIEEFDPQFVEGDTPVDADAVTLVIPERARHGGELQHGKLMVLHHADALPVDVLTSSGGNNYLVEAPRVIPDRGFAPSDKPDWNPDERWVAGHEGHWVPEDPGSMRCIVCLGERSPVDVFGVEEMPGRRIDEGETVSTENTLLFAPAPKENPTSDPGVWDPAEVFDAGYPTPMGGPSYGLGVIATPNAEIAGESVNPLARMSGEQLLTSDQARGVLADAGLTDAEEVEWLRGPERAPGSLWTPLETVSVLGEEVGLESYAGVVSGEAGPWAVAIHMAKATDDDAVFSAAMHRRPVGSPDGRALVGDGTGFVDRQWTTRALEFTSEVVASLETAAGASTG